MKTKKLLLVAFVTFFSFNIKAQSLTGPITPCRIMVVNTDTIEGNESVDVSKYDTIIIITSEYPDIRDSATYDIHLPPIPQQSEETFTTKNDPYLLAFIVGVLGMLFGMWLGKKI